MKGNKALRSISALWLALFLFAMPYSSYAANKILISPGTPITFADAAQTPTGGTFTLTGVAAGTGWYSTRYDKGAGSKSWWWGWRCHAQLTGTNVPGEPIEWYVSTSDSAAAANFTDGQLLATPSAALPTDKRKNLKLMGILYVDQFTSNATMTASGYVEIKERYFALAVWNGASLNFNANTGVHGCSMTPFDFEVQ
jgi:hypothetical protein